MRTADGRRVTAAGVTLPGRVWRAELARELGRLGVKEPERNALRVLQRVCGRAGWPRETHRVAVAPPEAPQEAP